MKNVTDFRKTVEVGVDPPIESKHHLLTLVKREPICFSLQQPEVNTTARVTQGILLSS